MSLPDDLKLIEITDLNFFLVESLAEESKQEGYAFVERTINDWKSGDNRFSKPGERFWGLISGTEIIGFGGLNRDPYTAEPNVGRVRHLYIRQVHRRKGYATLLMQTIMNHAREHFTILRLFTDTPDASEFYKTLGFQQVNGPQVSHILSFEPSFF